MFIRNVFILSFIICASAQSETLSGTVEGTARLNVVFPELDLKSDNNGVRRQLQAPMVDPSGLQSKETNSLRLLQLQMEILRMQDMVKRQLAEENSRAKIVTRKPTTTTTEGTPKKIDSENEPEDNATRLGRLLESLSGSGQKKTVPTFQLDGIQDEIESLQKQLGKITANRARNANESNLKNVVNSPVIKKPTRVSYFDALKEGSKPRSSDVPHFRSRESEDNDLNDDSNSDNARAASTPSLLSSLERQLLKYQNSLNDKKYVNPKYFSMYETDNSKEVKKYKPDIDFEDAYERHSDFSHGHNLKEHTYDEKFELNHVGGESREFNPSLANPITNFLSPTQVSIGGDGHNAVLDLVLEIVRLAAGGDGRGLLGAIIRLPALIIRGLLKTIVSALASGGLRGLIVKFLVPLIVLVAVNLLIIFLTWWLWEDGHCDVENKVEIEKNFYG